MKIDILSQTTLKLTLSPQDMSEYDLCYESLSERGAECRRTLGRLLKRADKPESAAMAARLLGDERRLFVEAFRRMDGGCMLYVSALSGRRRTQLLDESIAASPLIFETCSQTELGRLCRCLTLEKGRGAEFSSRLFTDGSRYRLALIPQNTCRSRLLRVFREYGQAICDELEAAVTEEHFRLLIEENAVEIGEKVY